MATYVVLASLTGSGDKKHQGLIGRADAFRDMAKESGVTVKDLYLSLGRYDVIAICEAPDDETAAVLSTSASSQGNVRTETLRVLSKDEMEGVLAKMV